MTKDGREFGKLTEKEVDGLERSEKKAYYAWKNAQLDATVIAQQERNVQLDAKIIAKQEK